MDLDGTLLLSDALVESFCQLLKTSPWLIVLVPFWLLGGKANLKAQIAKRVTLEVGTWPLNEAVLKYAQAAKAEGRRLVLATATDSRIANAVQQRLGLFDELICSDGHANVLGEAKAAALVKRFGEKQFDYVGDRTTDLPVWRVARRAGVAGDPRLVEQVRACTTVEKVFPVAPATIKDWARALRVHQWAKNFLLLVPVLSSHQWMEWDRMSRVLLGFVAFSLCASSVYLLNDLLDLENDRQHPSKRNRPFASGRLPLVAGLLAAPALLALATATALLLGWQFAAIFGVYYLTTAIYSLRLKQIVLLDVLTLAGLYGIRVLAGGLVADVPVSDWLIMFSLFLFLSLAFAKRFTEICAVKTASAGNRIKGRGYVSGDSELVRSMGVGSGYLSVLVLGMYISHPDVTRLYHHPQVLWLVCPFLLYWVSRVWLLAHRGTLHDDPIVFALSDRQSWLLVLLLALIGFAAGPK